MTFSKWNKKMDLSIRSWKATIANTQKLWQTVKHLFKQVKKKVKGIFVSQVLYHYQRKTKKRYFHGEKSSLILWKEGQASIQFSSYMSSFLSRFDPESEGFVSTEELEFVLTNLPVKIPKPEIEEMIKAADGDGDGRISFPEFRRLVGMWKVGKRENGRREAFQKYLYQCYQLD